MPRVKVGGVITSAAFTLIEIVPDTMLFPCESVTFAVKVNVPGVVVEEMVPLIVPLLLRVRPLGRVPEFMAQVNGPTPPVCVSVAV